MGRSRAAFLPLFQDMDGVGKHQRKNPDRSDRGVCHTRKVRTCLDATLPQSVCYQNSEHPPCPGEARAPPMPHTYALSFFRNGHKLAPKAQQKC